MSGDEIRTPVNPYGEESPIGMTELTLASQVLQQARLWVLLVGVIAMVVAILLTLSTVGLAVTAAVESGSQLPADIWLPLSFPFLGAVMCFLPGLLLLKFSRQIKEFSHGQTVRHLNAALATHKSFWKTIGICSLIFLVVYLTMVGVVVFVGVSAN